MNRWLPRCCQTQVYSLVSADITWVLVITSMWLKGEQKLRHAVFLELGLALFLFYYCLILVRNRIIMLHGDAARPSLQIWEELPCTWAQVLGGTQAKATRTSLPDQSPRERSPGMRDPRRCWERPWKTLNKSTLLLESLMEVPRPHAETNFIHKQLFLLGNTFFHWANFA